VKALFVSMAACDGVVHVPSSPREGGWTFSSAIELEEEAQMRMLATTER